VWGGNLYFGCHILNIIPYKDGDKTPYDERKNNCI